MILTAEQYQTLSGDTTTAEATIQQALYRYTAIIEGYCNRTFGAVEQTETYYDVQRDPLVLNRDHVVEISAITVGTESADVDDFTTHKGNGFIYHDGAWFGQNVTITYAAGLPAPYDVKHVLAALVQSFLAGDSGGVNQVRPVSKETVYGVASTQYALPLEGEHPELGSFTALLDRYCEPVLA